MLPLRSFRNQPKGLPDLLNLERLVAPGVVKTKSGAYLAGWFYRGRDLLSSTAAERNNITARVNAALSRLGTGWVTWHDAVRLPSPGYPAASESFFPDAVTALIDEERRAYFSSNLAHFESEYVWLVMYQPPQDEVLRLDRLFYEDDQVADVEQGRRLRPFSALFGRTAAASAIDNADVRARADAAQAAENKIIASFVHVLDDMRDVLSDVVRMRRMGRADVTVGDQTVHRDELVSYLHYCVTGEMQPINIPECPMYLDMLIGGQELLVGDTPRIGESFVGCVAIEGFPAETMPNILDALDNLAMPYRWSSRMIYLDAAHAHARLDKYRRHWDQKKKGFWAQLLNQPGIVNEDAVRMAGSAQGAMSDANSGAVLFGFYTPVIVLFAPTREVLDERCRVVTREVRRLGFGCRRETINTMQAWHGAIPGHPEANIRQPVIHTLNLADLLPLASVWPGQSRNPCAYFPPNSPPLLHAATNGSTPFRLNLHVGDRGHTLIFGPTGAGKSSILALIAAQFRRYPNSTIVAFDKGRSLLPLARAAGSAYYEIAADAAGLTLCPLQHLETDADVLWAAEWIETIYALQHEQSPSPRQREHIFRALQAMRESQSGSSLTDFTMTVQDEMVRSAVSYYTLSGPMGFLLDGKRESLVQKSFTVFDVDELMALGDKASLPALLYLFRYVERLIHGQPGLLLLDEAWIVLGHPAWRAKLKGWLKEMRRKNWSVVPATQSLSDAYGSGIFDVLVESCPTKILLPNEEARVRGSGDTPGPRDYYEAMGLNDTEIELLASATPKRHYYYRSPEGRRLIDLAMGPVTLAFCGVSDKAQVTRVAELADEHGEAWPFVWLEERGVDYERYLNEVVPVAA